MGNSIQRVKVTIGGPEATAGTAEARTAVVPIRAKPDLDRKPEMQDDPAIVGANMAVAEYLVADSVEGAIPLAFRPCTAIGMILKSLLGTETSTQVAACIRVRYTGAQPSCKLIADTAGNTLVSKIGVLGAEANDPAFGVAGSIDLTNIATDTVGELVAVIEAYANYEAQKIFGADAVAAGEILNATVSADGRWAYLWFGGAATGVYAHKFTSDLTATERKTYSLQKDGFQDNYLYDGWVCDKLSISAAMKGIVEADADGLGMKETAGQVASVLTMPDVDPLIFWNGSFSLGVKDYPVIRNLSLEVGNNHNREGYGQGVVGRQYQEKGNFDVTGNCQLKLDSVNILNRPGLFTGAQFGISGYFKGKLITTAAINIPELVLFEIPYCRLSNWEWPENSGLIDAGMPFKAFKPKGTIYNDPFTLTILTTDAAVY